jgi:hypothetical protein
LFRHGILVARDTGVSWGISRLAATPVKETETGTAYLRSMGRLLFIVGPEKHLLGADVKRSIKA